MVRQHGFTLIELLMAVAIVGILAAVAWPSYTRHVVRVRRTEAQVALMEAMHQQERFQLRHGRYAAFSALDDDGDAQGFKWWSGKDAAGSAYELDAHACPGADIADCVEIRARPGTDRVDARFRDPDCGTLTLDSRQRHGAQAAPGANPHCWP